MGNLIGQIINQQFRVDAFLASGGMGDVYKVYDLHRNVTLALKVLRADLAEDPDMLKRFRREGKALQKLAHPNIVTFYDLHQANGLTFLLEKYIDGPSLASVLKKNKNRPIPLMDALTYMKAMCAALGFAHANHVVHCDVKPGNVMIDHSGKIYLTDFGIVRHADSDATSLATAGAPAYMAPEQIRGEPVSPATDVYALGVTLFEMLTGQRPFRVSDPGSNNRINTASEQIIQGHLSKKSPDPGELNPNISTELSLVVQAALSKDPNSRYEDAKSFFKAVLAATGYSMDQVPEQVHSIQEIQPVARKPEVSGSKNFRWERLLINLKLVPKWAWIIGSIIIFVLFASEMLANRSGNNIIKALFPSQTFTPTSTMLSTRTPSFTATPLPSSTLTSTPTPAPTPEPNFEWFPETLIRGNLSTGYFTSMVIDDQGVIHLVYFQDDYDVLFYSTLHNGQWTAEKVVGGMGSGFHASLALNSQGNPIIAYHIVDYPNNIPRLVMMKWTGSSWQRFQNTQNEAANTDISMAISPDDSLHFSFMDNYSKQVIYSHFLGNQYKNQAIDDAYADCQSFPIVVDQKGYPHLLYQAKEGGLYHATWQGTTWLREQIDPAYGSGYYSALAVDKEGILHIAYYNRDNMKLWYAYQQSNSWETYLVDSNGDVGQYPSIVVDEEGFIHISYYDSTNEDLKYAYGHNDSWSIVTVDSNGNVGLWNSLALDPAGFPYISYLDETNYDLKLAKSLLRIQKP